MAAGEARGSGNRSCDRVDELERGGDRCARAAAHDLARDRGGMPLLAVLAQRVREPALVPLGDDVACAERETGVHAHVEWRVVGVGEAALARIELSGGHPEVEVRGVGLDSLLGEQRERLGVAGADEADGARDLGLELARARLGVRVAVDRDQRPGGAEALGDEPRVAAVAEGAVDRDRPRARAPARGCERVEQLAREHGRVPAIRRGGFAARAIARGTPLADVGAFAAHAPRPPRAGERAADVKRRRHGR